MTGHFVIVPCWSTPDARRDQSPPGRRVSDANAVWATAATAQTASQGDADVQRSTGFHVHVGLAAKCYAVSRTRIDSSSPTTLGSLACGSPSRTVASTVSTESASVSVAMSAW